MTQEQKARAYDDALTTAKRIISKNCSEVEKLCLKCIFPTLAESDDERIRKALIDALKTSKSVGELKFILPEPTREECIAYLEKQKEQKHILKFNVGDKVHLEGDDVNILTITGIEKDRYLTDCAYGPILFGAEDIWEKIEQKSTDTEWDELQADFRNINEAFENGKKEVVDNSERYGLCRPAEWSEEDEKMIKSILFVLESYVSQSESASSPSLITTYPTYYKEIDWLKSLPFNLKKKNEDVAKLCSNEWSGEDEEMFFFINELLVNKGRDYFNTLVYDAVQNWLKNRFKSLCPSWKPSKEQMEALNLLLCRGELSFMSQAKTLRSLYNDLEKLM